MEPVALSCKEVPADIVVLDTAGDGDNTRSRPGKSHAVVRPHRAEVCTRLVALGVEVRSDR